MDQEALEALVPPALRKDAADLDNYRYTPCPLCEIGQSPLGNFKYANVGRLEYYYFMFTFHYVVPQAQSLRRQGRK